MTEKRCLVCGNPVGYHRSRYCSEECSEMMHHHNLGVLDSPDDQEIVGAWLEPDELAARNLELAKYGRRICRTHQGAALPLTDEYFYTHDNGRRFETECKRCYNKRNVEARTRRYRQDAQFRAQECQRVRERKRAEKLVMPMLGKLPHSAAMRSIASAGTGRVELSSSVMLLSPVP